jgi:ubiquinone/menaquinone biosynthesis C-methylase UbiE
MSEIFNAMAAKYDTPERIALAQLVTQTLEPYFKDNQHQTLIDIGGGTGLVSLPLAAYVQHLAIWDTAPGMIEVSEKKNQPTAAGQCFCNCPRSAARILTSKSRRCAAIPRLAAYS